MWEAIRANTRRSRLLIGLMGAILVGLGYLIGVVYAGPEAGVVGALGALAVWLVLLTTALVGGERVLLLSARAREIKKEDAPRLWNVVEEMTIASGLGKIPKIYIIDDDMPNAFAAGRKPEVACVAVTSGLLKRLNRDELQGVIAHEIGHVKNYDIRFMTIAGVMVGAVTIIADVFLRSLWYGGGRRMGRRGGGQAQLVIVLAAIAVAILAPIFTQVLYFACSRRREYLADASAARFTRYPPGLASALEKISGNLTKRKGVVHALAPMYIVNPLQARGSSVGLFSTHPPTKARVRILRSMGGNAGWLDYEAAYRKVTGSRGACLDQRTLQSEKSVPARAATVEPEAKKDAVQRAREVADFLDRTVNFLLIGCLCGVRIKVPPQFKQKTIKCTRCGREHAIPTAEPEAGPVAAKRRGPLRYRRQGKGWESFKCSCGKVVQISPAFRGTSLSCKKCKQKIEIVA